ncbi:MAG: hypothetical protein IJL48_05865 [Bacteroidales bacterium]|nr:hypothetical protein [Bacteroidales bacterium]
MKKKRNCITVYEVRAGRPKETIEEVKNELDKTLKEKDLKVKKQFLDGGKHEDGTNKTLKEIENEQVI